MKRLPKIGITPITTGKQIVETFTGHDIFRGEHPENENAFKKATKARMTAKKRRSVWYRFTNNNQD